MMPAMLTDLPHPCPTPALPVAEDQHVDAELDIALRTASTLVVSASLEVEPAGAGTRSLELALVIPRSRCQGERPGLAALLDAVQAAVARATRGGTLYRPRRVLTRVSGQPHLVAQF